MEAFRESLLLMISVPIYAALILLEIIVSNLHDKRYYSSKGTLANMYLSAANMGLDLLTRVFCLFILNYFYTFHVVEISHEVVYWTVLFLLQDFMFYVLHVVDHYCRLFWAVHVTHHSSEEFNLTVGFRSSVFQPLYRFIYFIPLTFLGFKGIDIMFIYAVAQIYGILLHTQYIKKLGFLEWVLVTPSHHRVHHASNVLYLDKNMGMVFIIWDRLFGTFQEETEQPKFGLTENINTHHPLKMVFHEWINMLHDLKKAPRLKEKLMYVFGPPGWSHDGSKKTSKQLKELHAPK